MSGVILQPDQVAKVNALYTRIYAHIKELLSKEATAFERMKVRLAAVKLNTDELAKIFMEIPFLPPIEKQLLVELAIDEVLHGRVVALEVAPNTDHAGVLRVDNATPAKAFTPPQFKLNVAKSEAAKVADTPPAQVPTPAVVTKLADLKVEQKANYDKAQADREAKAAEIRAEVPKINIATTESHQVD